jgi:hypothetical protein
MAQRKLLLSVVVVGMFGTAAFALAPMGPPVAGLPQGSHAVGIGYFHSDMNLEISGPGIGTSGGSGAAVLTDVQSDLYYVGLGYGISDDWALYGGVGVANAEFPADGSGAPFDGDDGFGFGIGTVKTLAEDGDIKWGILGQLTQGKSEDNVTVAAGGQTFGNGNISSPLTAGRHEMKLEWYEVQVALGPAVPVCEGVCLYGGPFLHFLEGDLEIKGSRDEFELEQRLQLGAYIGALVSLGDPNASLKAEFLWTGEAWGIGIGASIRCP